MLKMPARVALGLMLPLSLYACSSPPTPGTPDLTPVAGSTPAAYGDGLDHSWTSDEADGQRLLSAFSGGLKAQGIGLDLSLTLTAASGWGPIEINSSNGETAQFDGRPLSLGGTTYATGLGLHADSDIHIHATGLETPACTRFQAVVGVDDEVGDRGSVTFLIYADGEQVYSSGELTGAMGGKSIDVPLGGKSDLRFVTVGGADNYFDHADWAEPNLGCSAPPVITPPSCPDGCASLSVSQNGRPGFIGFLDIELTAPGRSVYGTISVYESGQLVNSSNYQPDKGPNRYYFDPRSEHDFTVVARQNSGEELRQTIHTHIQPH